MTVDELLRLGQEVEIIILIHQILRSVALRLANKQKLYVTLIQIQQSELILMGKCEQKMTYQSTQNFAPSMIVTFSLLDATIVTTMCKTTFFQSDSLPTGNIFLKLKA